MWKTATLLIITLIIVPWLAILFEPPLPEHIEAVLRQLIYVYLIAALICFLVSTLAVNYSQVDKLWSLMPLIYAWITCFQLDFESRLVLMAALVSVWGLRLTFNFARRGGYSLRFWEGEEDYRWAEVRKQPGFSSPWAWALFNFTFVSFYQMGLILLFTLPIVKSAGGGALSVIDWILAALFLLFVCLEALADRQQWLFQTEKHRLLAKGGKLPTAYAQGFVNRGLWARVRHPNYACEQAVWIVFYLFSVVASGQWLNWSITGVLLLIILFRSSSQLSEQISARKYPEYRDYIATVPRFIPYKL